MSKRRCEARIWPSSWSAWGQCPGYINSVGNCTAYGSQHRVEPAVEPAPPTDGLRELREALTAERDAWGLFHWWPDLETSAARDAAMERTDAALRALDG